MTQKILGPGDIRKAAPRTTVFVKPRLVDMSGEALRAGTTLPVEGLGVPKSDATVVSPTLGIVGQRTTPPINKTSVRDALNRG